MFFKWGKQHYEDILGKGKLVQRNKAKNGKEET